MNTPSRMFQRIGGLGIVYSVLFAAGLFLSGNEPGTSAGGAAVVRYYHSHRVAELASVFLIMAAAVVFTFFLVSLGRTLGRTTEGRQLAPIIMAGGAVYVGGLLSWAPSPWRWSTRAITGWAQRRRRSTS